MSTLATWSHVVQSRDVSPHNFDGLAMSGLAFSVAPLPSGVRSEKVLVHFVVCEMLLVHSNLPNKLHMAYSVLPFVTTTTAGTLP